VGSGEVGRIVRWVLVAAIGEIALDDLLECRVIHKAAEDAIQQGSESRDRGGEHEAPGTDYAARLAECGDAFGALLEMVKRTHEQYGVRRAVGELEGTRVADSGGGEFRRFDPIVLKGLLNMPRRCIHQVDGVAEAGEPERIDAGGAPDVDDNRWWSGQMLL